MGLIGTTEYCLYCDVKVVIYDCTVLIGKIAHRSLYTVIGYSN